MNFFDIINKEYSHESILSGFPATSDDIIIINFCILYTKQYIYYVKKKKNENFNIDISEHLSHLKHTLTVTEDGEKRIFKVWQIYYFIWKPVNWSL